MRTIQRTVLAGLSAVVLLVSLTGGAAADGGTATYRVTILNLTHGQPFTPPMVAIHRHSVDVFTVGTPASFGVKEIAENGNLGPLQSALNSTAGVGAVLAATAPLVPIGSPGQTVHGFSNYWTTTITAPRDARRISWVSMLVCTNDGFTGVNSLKLPRHVGDTMAHFTAGYDAGTEINTEAFADIVPPCQGLIGVTGDPGTGTSNPTLAEGGVIHHHPGIAGVADLVPATHGWTDPVGLIVVERIG